MTEFYLFFFFFFFFFVFIWSDHGLFKKMTNQQVQDLFNIRITRGSLVFVIDVTDSMKEEIDAVKDKTIEIVERTKGTRNAPSSFVLSTFSDPGIVVFFIYLYLYFLHRWPQYIFFLFIILPFFFTSVRVA